MGTFNVKNFFGSMFTPVEDEMEENYYGEEEGYIEEDAYEQEPIAEEAYYGGASHLRSGAARSYNTCNAAERNSHHAYTL